MTVTDTLLTLLKMVGGPAYSREMEKAAKATDNLARAEGERAARGKALNNLLGDLGVSNVLLASKVGAVTYAVSKAVQTFAEDETAIFRATVVLRNLGNSFPIERAQAFAAQIQKSVAIDDEAVVALIGLEKRFGIADDQIEKTTKTIIDFSKATGIGLEEAGSAVGRALLGQSRGLRALGIDFKATGDKAKDLATIQEKLNALFGGAGEAERNTVAGTFTALREAMNNLLSTIGDKLSTVIIPVVNALTAAIQFLADHAQLATAAFGALAGLILGGPLGALIGGLLGLGAGFLPSRANPAEKIGTGKGGLATEATLAKIEDNTKKTADAFVRQVLGGPGVVAKGAFTQRDARLAFGI